MDGTKILNHVSYFDTAAGIQQARIDALQKVTTPAFIFIDSTDTFLGKYTEVPKGLIYGSEDIYCTINKTTQKVIPETWSMNEHLYKPHFIHKAICNTEVALKVAKHLPVGEYYFEWLFYFFIATWRDATIVPGDFYLWRKEPTGMHTKVSRAVMNTSLWLHQNHKRVLLELQK